MEFAIWLIFAAIAALGLLTGRWSVLLLPLIVWPALYGAMDAGWIGSGLGEGWGYAATVVLTASLAVTAACVVLGRKRRSGW